MTYFSVGNCFDLRLRASRQVVPTPPHGTFFLSLHSPYNDDGTVEGFGFVVRSPDQSNDTPRSLSSQSAINFFFLQVNDSPLKRSGWPLVRLRLWRREEALVEGDLSSH